MYVYINTYYIKRYKIIIILSCYNRIAVINVLVNQIGILVDTLIIIALRQGNEQCIPDKIADNSLCCRFVLPMIEFGYFFFDFCQQLNGELFNLFYVLG